MRITPIMAYKSQNLQSKKQNKQNVRFGKFENEKTKKYVKENFLTEENEPYSSQMLDYIDNTPFFTVKMTKGLDGKPFVYAVMNKAETDKHKHKDKFDELREWNYNPNTFITRFRNKPAKEAGTIKSEPEFLTVLEDFKDTLILSENFIKAEQGYEPPKTTPSKSESSSNERNNFDDAVMLNGGGIFLN